MPSLRALLLTAAAAAAVAGCQAPSQPDPPPGFPEGWIGRWRGDLRVFAGVEPTRVPMELQISRQGPDWRWQITYGAGDFGAGDRRDVRDYLLRPVDPSRGEYEIDERNSIVLPAVLRGGTLVCKFTVGDSEIVTLYRRSGATILFELIAATTANPRRSGGGSVPAVVASRIQARQQAVLRRVPDGASVR